MRRRRFLKLLAGSAAAGALAPILGEAGATSAVRRVRPGEQGWPDDPAWKTLGEQVRGNLRRVESPFGGGAVPPELVKQLENPYFVGDQAWATQSTGWAGAWTSSPSAWVVAARTAEDVAAAVSLAREHRLRLVVKGGGHSYQGTSNAPGSLLVWTRPMDAIALHDAFVGAGCAGRVAPEPA